MTAANLIPNRLVKEEIEGLRKTLSAMPKRAVPLIKDKTRVDIAAGRLGLDTFVDDQNYIRVSVGVPDI